MDSSSNVDYSTGSEDGNRSRPHSPSSVSLSSRSFTSMTASFLSGIHHSSNVSPHRPMYQSIPHLVGFADNSNMDWVSSLCAERHSPSPPRRTSSPSRRKNSIPPFSLDKE